MPDNFFLIDWGRVDISSKFIFMSVILLRKVFLTFCACDTKTKNGRDVCHQNRKAQTTINTKLSTTLSKNLTLLFSTKIVFLFPCWRDFQSRPLLMESEVNSSHEGHKQQMVKFDRCMKRVKFYHLGCLLNWSVCQENKIQARNTTFRFHGMLRTHYI